MQTILPINSVLGNYERCSSIEAAVLCGVTRTSLMRILREGRNGTNGFIVRRV